MNFNQYVKPVEQGYLLTSIFRVCKNKTTKKTYPTDKVSSDEKSQFENCILKYILSSEYSYDGLREGAIIARVNET